MMYKEFAFAKKNPVAGGCDIFTRNILREESYALEFVAEHPNDSCYATYMSYDQPDQDNSVLSAPFVIDIDSEDNLELARQEAKKICNIFGTIKIKPLIYFSGAKGFHLKVPFECFGVEPRYHLIAVYKKLAKGLVEANHLKYVDLVIYERKRVLRLVNTVNIKTGLYKIPISLEELDLPIGKIMRLAENKRKDFKSETVVNEQLKSQYMRAEISYMASLEKKSATKIITPAEIKMLPCVKKLLKGAAEGERNESCYTLALFFKSQNVLEDDAMDLLKNFSGLTPSESGRTVKSAYKSTHRWGCNENDLVQRFCDKTHCPYGFQRKMLDDLLWDKEELISMLKKEENGEFNTNLTLGVPEFEEAWGNLRKDELIVCAAEGGMGKTAYALWMMRKNIELGNRILYCSLEMSTHALLHRACKDGNGNYREIEDWIRNDNVMFYKDGEKLSTKNLRRNLEESLKHNFGVDMIIIDHLGYIEKVSDKIYEATTQIVEDLSVFSKDLSVPTFLMTHFNKGAAGASDKPRSPNDVLGSGRIKDFSSKFFQIWRVKENNPDNVTAFLLHKNRYGDEKTVKLRFKKGGYVYDERDNPFKY